MRHKKVEANLGRYLQLAVIKPQTATTLGKLDISNCLSIN